MSASPYMSAATRPRSSSRASRVSRRGTYSFRGRAKNVAGDAYRLAIRGRFKSDRKARQRTTIKRKGCSATERITLKSGG